MTKSIKWIKVFKNFLIGVIPAGILTQLPAGDHVTTILTGFGVAIIGLMEYLSRRK